jgi:hypothetical protein
VACSCEEPVQAAATEPLDAPFPVPAYPPAEWFTERPDWLTPETKIEVDDEGRVAGYFYQHGQCLVHDAKACPTSSPTGYAAFHQQQVVLADGSTIRVGVIGNTNGHASPYARVDVAQAHYADPDRQLMSVRAYDDEHGGYVLGAMVPRATYGDVALVRRSALSGDWRPMPTPWWVAHGVQANAVKACEGYDCIGPTLVTRPGLPLVRTFRQAAILGGAGGVQLEQEPNMATIPSTTIDLGNGMKITTNQPDQFYDNAGPVPMQAASPPPPPPPKSNSPAGAGGDAGPDEASESTTLADLDKRVSALEDTVGQIVDMINQAQAASLAAIEAQARPLPPEDDADPKA